MSGRTDARRSRARSPDLGHCPVMVQDEISVFHCLWIPGSVRVVSLQRLRMQLIAPSDGHERKSCRILLTVICLSIQFLTVARASAGASGPTPGTELHTSCTGPVDTGSGTAGSVVGSNCYLPADSDEQRMVQAVCEDNSKCRVDGTVRVLDDGRLLFTHVAKVRLLVRAPSSATSYVRQVGQALDGILAPEKTGCDNPQDTARDRVSVLLDRDGGGVVQTDSRYCTVGSASGTPVTDDGFHATLQLSCGPLDSTDSDLRAGKTQDRRSITVVQDGSAPVKIDNEPYVRCPIKPAYTPAWWIRDNPTFRGKFPAR